MKTFAKIGLGALGLGALGFSAMATSAQAADLPVRVDAVPSAPAAPLFTGFYIGGHLGFASRENTFTDVVNPLAGTAYITVLGTDRFTASRSGVVGGLQTGYNWRFGNIIAGLEADAGYFGGNSRRASSVPAALGEVIGEIHGGAYGSLRGRLGVAAGQFMVFLTGGLIGAETGARVTDAFAPTTLFTNRAGVRAGWTLGGGVEYAIAQNWTAKADYLYFDLGKHRISGQINGLPGPINTFSWDARNSGHIVRLGVNYWFGGSAPVVAKY